jgi:hypothetical protein
MVKTKGNLAQDISLDAVKLFQDLIEKNGLKVRLSPIGFRQLEDGSLLLDQSKLLISFKIQDGKSK